MRQMLSPGAIPFAPNVHAAAIPAFDNGKLQPRAFNDFDEFVGDSEGVRAFKWQATRGLTVLHNSVWEFGDALAVNDHGQVAVTLSGDSGGRAGIWDWNGNITVLRPLGIGMTCGASGINNQGVVVGACAITVGSDLATVWTRFGTPDGLHPGGGATLISGQATAISDSGYITGNNPWVQNGQGFLFTATRQEILLPPAISSPAVTPGSVNDSGWVAGKIHNPNTGNSDPAIWTQGASVHDLYNGEGLMFGISDDGIAVGTVTDSTTKTSVPVIWTAANGLQRLPGLEGYPALVTESGQALQINRQHHIWGYVTLASGMSRYVIWTLPF
jgi:hypothetical protein